MQHRKLDALMSSIEKIARVAAAGVEQARAAQTEPSGAKSYDNADGTRTIIGNIANGESNPSFTMATHVGDTTAPGTPTGITASSKGGVVVVEWDGTLSGGVPDDFFCVRIYLDGSDLGVLREAGSVSSAKLEGGTTHSVTATAEDDCCLPDGTPAHNVSDATQALSVTVERTISGVDVEYADSTSQTVAPTTGWSTEAPAWQEGHYIWQRTATYSGSSVSYSEPTCISGRDGQDGPAGPAGPAGPQGEQGETGPQGPQGETGATGPQGPQGATGPQGEDGVGISAIEEQYYLSTSDQSPTGGSWSPTQPTWEEGTYIWTRSQVTWTDGQVTETTPVLAKAVNLALETSHEVVQHFWHDADGAHVTEVTQEEWEDSSGSSHHSGMNVLIKAAGQFFRDGLNNLLSLGSSGMAIFDGQGNADSNIIANIRTTAAEFARQFDWAQASTGDVEFFGGLAGVHVESTPFTPEGGTAPTVVDMITRVDGELDLRDEGYGYAGGALEVQQEVSQNGVPQVVTSITAASSKGTGDGYASLGVSSSATGSSAISATADTIVFQGSSGGIIDTATMLETVNSIRTASKTLNLATTNIGGGTKTVYLERQGHIVTAYYGGTLTPTAANTLYTVGTIPSGYRPKRGCFANCNGIVNNAIMGRTARWRFLNTGAVQVICSGTGITEYPFGVSWFTDDDWPS